MVCFDTEAKGNLDMSYFKFLLRESNGRLKPTLKSIVTLYLSFALDSMRRVKAIKTLKQIGSENMVTLDDFTQL